MVARALTKYVRVSPQKSRMVLPLIRGKQVTAAMAILTHVSKKGAGILAKTLKSAISNAKNKGYDENKLYISRAIINAGPSMKRFRAASFGRACQIYKRTSHLLIELDSPERITSKVKES